ncbi:uncharacterized protein LOC142995037 isoform X2 [Genypterus blacodes]|uniref:uncharacterized protein LOC142995037 isoform X2 n=1 Tax=Genypterus blacodes TaxID=154954 RepID=UPI003F75D3CD
MVSIRLALLFLWVIPDLVRCGYFNMQFESLPVTLGKPVTLNCTFNCTSGFVRGCWKTKMDSSDCLGKQISNCTVFYRIPNLTTRDLKRIFHCYTQYTDDPNLKKKIERIVTLRLQAQTIAPNWTAKPKTTAGNVSLSAEPKDQTRGDLTGIKVLATVTIVVAIVLAALAVHLCVNRNRQSWNEELVLPMSASPSAPPHGVCSPAPGSSSTHCERVIVRIPTPDNESDDTEVPYADIMITVRGVSTPELSQVSYLTPGDQKECWLDESRYVLQASRSADRLHVHQPREVSRKMSTNSEYAVITYA